MIKFVYADVAKLADAMNKKAQGNKFELSKLMTDFEWLCDYFNKNYGVELSLKEQRPTKEQLEIDEKCMRIASLAYTLIVNF